MTTAPIGVDSTETFIHAGLPRTGTTTLQTHLFARHTQVHYLGVFKGKLARERPPIDRSSRGLTLFRDAQVDFHEIVHRDPPVHRPGGRRGCGGRVSGRRG